MSTSTIMCEGYARQDEKRYEEMLKVEEACTLAEVSPPDEAILFIKEYEGEEENIQHRKVKRLRPMIDKGVYLKKNAILIDIDEIDQDIDFIKIYLEED